VLALAATLTNARLPGATEIVATFRSLSVNYDSLLTTGRDLEQAVRALVKRSDISSQVSQSWAIQVPGCADHRRLSEDCHRDFRALTADAVIREIRRRQCRRLTPCSGARSYHI
jgi:allophanate hydrolase subunit 1